VIAGPTASGKSALAIDVAKRTNGVVLNADSMQVYRGIPIITACPSAQDRAVVEHRLFEIYDCAVRGNVVDWLNRIESEIRSLWQQGQTPVVVGGTGLYIDNLINGTTPIPETSEKTRANVARQLRETSSVALHQKLAKLDPETANRLNPNDTSRIVRALEVCLDTGILLSQWYQKPMIKRFPEADFEVIKLCPPTEELDQRCYLRLDKMIQDGALSEIEALNARGLDPSLPAMKALGVPELLSYVRGERILADALDDAKLHTRQYAKRQRTWFKNKLTAQIELKSCYCGDQNVLESLLER
jgi:tRNA dimethylallyltransferase